MRSFLLSIGLFLLLTTPIPAQNEPARIGLIYIVGNERTPDSVIRKHVDLYPGQFLEYQEVRTAEDKLAKSGLFVVDPSNRIRPTITVIEDVNGPFKDIVINVQEARSAPPTVVEPSVIEPRRSGILRGWLPMRRT